MPSLAHCAHCLPCVVRLSGVVQHRGTKVVTTAVGIFYVHHLHPDLFEAGEGATGTQSGVAVPEKAFFNTVYLLSAVHGKSVALLEVELPGGFNPGQVDYWVAKVPSALLRFVVARNAARLLDQAAAAAGGEQALAVPVR